MPRRTNNHSRWRLVRGLPRPGQRWQLPSAYLGARPLGHRREGSRPLRPARTPRIGPLRHYRHVGAQWVWLDAPGNTARRLVPHHAGDATELSAFLIDVREGAPRRVAHSFVRNLTQYHFLVSWLLLLSALVRARARPASGRKGSAIVSRGGGSVADRGTGTSRWWAIPVTCVEDGYDHLVGDEQMVAGRTGRYEALCGHRVHPAAMVCPPGRSCARCAAAVARPGGTAGHRRPGRGLFGRFRARGRSRRAPAQA